MMERIKRAVGIKAPPPPVPPDPNYTDNVWMLNGYCQKNSEFQDVNVVRYYNASIDPVQPNSICPVSILDTRYMLANGNGTAGVSSFNGRSGAVTLSQGDVQPITDQLYAPSAIQSDGVFLTIGQVPGSLEASTQRITVQAVAGQYEIVADNGSARATALLNPQGATTSVSSLVINQGTRINQIQSSIVMSADGPASSSIDLETYKIALTSGGGAAGGNATILLDPYSAIITSTAQSTNKAAHQWITSIPGATGTLTLNSYPANFVTPMTTLTFDYTGNLSMTANSLLTKGYADSQYAPIGSNGTFVNTFNGRSGLVTLFPSDVVNAVGSYYPTLTVTPSKGNATLFQLYQNDDLSGQSTSVRWIQAGVYNGTYLVTSSLSGCTTTSSFLQNYNSTIIQGGVSGRYGLSGTALNLTTVGNSGSLTYAGTGGGTILWTPNSLLTQGYADTRYAAIGGGGSNYTLPVANSTTLGGVMIGSNLTIDSNGVLSANIPAGGVTSFNTRSGSVTLLSTDVYPITDGRYMLANAPAGGVTSFNTRTGSVTLTANDVTPITNPLYLASVTKQFGAFGNATFLGNVTQTAGGYGFTGTAYQPGTNPNGHAGFVAGIGTQASIGGWAAGYNNPPGAELYCYNGNVTTNNGRLYLSSTGAYYDCTLTGGLSKSWSDSSILTRAYADSRYSQGGANGSLPVNGTVTGPINWTIPQKGNASLAMYVSFDPSVGMYFDNSDYPVQTITGMTVPNKGMADKWYAPKVSALTGREPVTTEVQLGDKFLQIEEGRIVGVISAAEREAWIQETDELIRKRGQ
jgi:hypothetical protein